MKTILTFFLFLISFSSFSAEEIKTPTKDGFYCYDFNYHKIYSYEGNEIFFQLIVENELIPKKGIFKSNNKFYVIEEVGKNNYCFKELTR